MYNLIRLYNQNRRKFWITTIAVIIITIIIILLIKSITRREQISTTQVQTPQINENTFNSVVVENKKSAVTGKDISSSKDSIAVIDQFVSYCNERKINEAYNLLSNDSKEKQYQDIRGFYNNYYMPLFANSKRNATVENWFGDIYKVSFTEDYLSTGKYTSSDKKQDYITVITDSQGEYKLNINSYIRATKINNTKTNNEVKISIVEKDTYMDYEIYTFEITNNSKTAVALLDTRYIDQSYLTDANNLKYYVVMSEISQEQVTCGPNEKKTIKLKYLNTYTSGKQIKALTFKNINLNYKSNNLGNTEVVFNF